ncbi:ribose-5-phosphate isomerase RpiA [Carnobacterium funditum]|uniref:ribose-5-phosphate isomerase RpiA n=1 Tax=Carnobacterium funditum TaxID=2752 RepID=UPI000555C2C9|nr:ribose-5-phosphate isomerase RpiA [Carnobacterium funditum]
MNVKQMVGEKAAEYVKDGMVVGLGTGSTAYYLVEALGKRVEKGLTITGVTTSTRTKEQAETLNIPLVDLNDVAKIDLTIDGSDEVSENYQGIKGGGGALLFEKLVANNSEKVIWIVDDSKMVKTLGTFPLPVEIVAFGYKQLFRLFESKNLHPELRLNESKKNYVTDGGHYIIDLHLESIENPHELATWLDGLTGVVEHGLFLDMVNTVIVGHENAVEVLDVR